MLKNIFKLLLLLVFALVAFLILNTVIGKKSIPIYQTETIKDSADSAALHLSKAIQIKTVSLGDTLPIETAAFIQFRNFMEATYPTISQQLLKPALPK